MSTRTDETGRYRFEGLLPTPLEVSVRSGPFGSFRQTVEIEKDDAEVLDIALPEPLELFGVVSDVNDVPVPGASVAAYTDRPGVMQVATTDEQGRYRFPTAPSGVRRMRVAHPAAGKSSSNHSVPAFGPHQLDLQLPGSITDVINELSGRLVDATGSPLDQWPILASSPEGSAVIAYTDEDGRFTASREGRWMKDLSAVSPRMYGRVVQSYSDLALSSTGLNLQVTTALGSIIGTVEDRSGGLPDDAEVQLYMLNGPYERATVSTASPGFEWSDLPPGEYQVRFQATGRATRKVPVKLEPGQTLDLGALVSSVGGSLELSGLLNHRLSWALVASGEGIVTDAVKVHPADPTLRRLPEGQVVVTILTLGSASQSFATTITRGQTTQHAVTAEPGHSHHLVITVGGCPPRQSAGGGFIVGYTVEDPTTGELIAALAEGVMETQLKVVSLAAGTYRVRAFTPEGHRGETLIQVRANDPDGSTPLNLVLPGLE